MAYVRNRFRDPAAVLATYSWTINHNEEDGADFRRNIERTATTDGVNFVRQQSNAGPRTFRFKGTLLTQEQYNAMKSYYDLCETQTIYFRDFQDDEYEVVITLFNPVRKRTSKNPRDASISLHYWTYDIELEVIGEV